MLSLDQLDDLEGRIIRALELIADLRDDNARLEQINNDLESQNTEIREENNQLLAEQQELQNQLAEKEQEIADIRKELEITNTAVEKIRSQEQGLQNRIDSILHQLDSMPTQKRPHRSGQGTGATAAFQSSPPSSPAPLNRKKEDTVPIRDPRQANGLVIDKALGEKKKSLKFF